MATLILLLKIAGVIIAWLLGIVLMGIFFSASNDIRGGRR